ncbi:MAG: hypothetical protein V7K14_09435 [Nostoc sp.]
MNKSFSSWAISWGGFPDNAIALVTKAHIVNRRYSRGAKLHQTSLEC